MLTISLALANAVPAGAQTPSTERSNYYTRGIGQYPGAPAEDFSPTLVPGNGTYRNIALHRKALASSNFDYNLTAHLVTDGLATQDQPQYIEVGSQNGIYPRREREWMLDQGPYSRNSAVGEKAEFNIRLNNWTERATEVQFRGNVCFEQGKLKDGYKIVFYGSNDGQNWTELAKIEGEKPGKPSYYKAHSDPNKNSWAPGELSTREVNETLKFAKAMSFGHYRLACEMEGVSYWQLFEINLFNENGRVDLLPSKHFSSAWMSETAGNEWISVDLGTVSKFDKVQLDWVNKAVEGKIQQSVDGNTWQDLASLPGGKALKDELKVNGNGRFVRVLMSKSADNQRYILSEMSVFGTGGLVAVPAQQPAVCGKELRLSGGNWKLQRGSLVKAGGEYLSTDKFTPNDWVVATVPGTVLSSYINIGAVPNPNYANDIAQISESFFNDNFWYRNEFVLPENFKKERLFLNFDGINWKANIYVNGKKIGRIDGAFTRGIFDVTNEVCEGKNIIAVEIIKNANIAAIKEKCTKNTDYNGGVLGADNPTFHASVGWDWITTVRGRNIGIWNDVYLTTTGAVTVADPLINTTLNLPDVSRATITPEVLVKNNSAQPVTGVLTAKVGGMVFKQTVSLAAGEEKNVVMTAKTMKNPRLWWPKGYGEPYLYDAEVSFAVGKVVTDSEKFKAGLRQMTYRVDNDVLSLYVNGRRFIGRGGNWGFSEHNLNYRGREYDAAVKYHADMNFTMIRNWVGQTGDREFYEACDKYGIMVWQDFWLANPADGPDPYDSDMFMANADDYVKRIRKHASIALYCGRNEGYPPENIDKALRKLLDEKHPGMCYISSSADDVVSGHGPYQALPAKGYFEMEEGRDKLHSERGMPNVMNYESMVRTFSRDALWPQCEQWGQHDYTMEGAQSCASFNGIIAKGYGEPTNVKDFSNWAQFVNYDGYRAMFESRSYARKGLILWMTHPCWPSMVWQTYDYYFDPTAAYFGCKKANEPLHIQWNASTDEVEVVNYSAGNHKQLTAKAQLINMKGDVAWQKEALVNSDEDTTGKPFKLEFPATLTDVHYVKLTLTDAKGNVVSDNFYLRGVEEGNYQALRELGKPRYKFNTSAKKFGDGTCEAVVRVENNGNVPALMLRINVVGANDNEQILPMIYSDNYFSLLPGESKLVTLKWRDEDTRGNEPKVVITSLKP